MDEIDPNSESFIKNMKRQLMEFDRQSLLWHTKVRVLRLARMITTGAAVGLVYL
jgi:hypothetical protein